MRDAFFVGPEQLDRSPKLAPLAITIDVLPSFASRIDSFMKCD